MVDIYKSVPTPQPEVMSGNPDTIKKIPRGERKQILLDSVTTVRYVPDLSPILADPDFAKYGGDNAGSIQPMAPTDPNAAPVASNGPQRGFLITIVGTTPNSGGVSYVYDTMVSSLLKITPKPGQKLPYAVVKASVVYSTLVKDSQTRMAAMQAAANAAHAVGSGSFNIPGVNFGGGSPETVMEDVGDGGGGFAPNFNVAGGGANVQPGQPNPYVDRVTGEDVQNDREFKILLAVVLDPAVPAAPQPGEGGAAPAGDAAGAAPAADGAAAPAPAENQ
jgi:hypothetical protein